MRSVNKVIIIGNLTRDPEMRQTPNGQSVTTFGVATNREWITKGNDRKNSAEFHECVAWARLAEICSQYLKKGQLVYIEGYLKTRSWDSPEGIKKFKTEIVVKDMIRLEKRSRDEGGEDYIPDEDDEYMPMDEGHMPLEENGNGNSSDNAPSSSEEGERKDNPIDRDLGL